MELKLTIEKPKIVEIFISDKFREVISQFYHDSMVAKLLLNRHHNESHLVEGYINYISICNKDPNMISYLDQDRMESKDPNFDFWTFKKRVVCKPGGFVKRLFRGVPDKEVEKFSNYYRATINKKPNEFKIVTGEDIRKYYLSNYYSQQRGSLGASCMKYPHTQGFLDFYISNPDVVSMVVLLDPMDMAIGRALLWDYKDSKGKDVKIMDRIYTIQDDQYQLEFKQWASKNNYLCKVQQSFSNTFGLEKFGDSKTEFQTEVQLKNFKFEKYPYLDTFKWMNLKTGLLTNYRPVDKKDIVTLASPDGSMHNYDYLNLCDVSRVYYYGHEISHLPYLNKNVHNSLVVYSETNNEYILKADSVYSDEARDNIFKDSSLNDQKSLHKRIDFFKKEIEKKKAIQKIREAEEGSRIERLHREIQRRSERLEWGQFTSSPRLTQDQIAQLINDIRNLRARGTSAREIDVVMRDVANAIRCSVAELVAVTEPDGQTQPTEQGISQEDPAIRYYGYGYERSNPSIEIDADTAMERMQESVVSEPTEGISVETTNTNQATNRNQRVYLSTPSYWTTSGNTQI